MTLRDDENVIDHVTAFPSLSALKQNTVADPVVSVLVRVKNEKRAIGALLSSLRRQTWFDRTELLVLDSGSTDGTLEEVLAFPAGVYAIAPEEFSFGGTCNLVCSLARAPILCIMSGHIAFEDPTLLERACAAVSGRTALSAAYFRQIPNSQMGSTHYERAYLRRRFPIGTMPSSRRAGQHAFSNAGSIFTRACWEQVSFPPVEASEDYLWAEAILAAGGEARYLPYLVIEHSHAEPPAKVRQRVTINVRARFGSRRLWSQAGSKFFGIAAACLMEGASVWESARYAAAHALPYVWRPDD